ATLLSDGNLVVADSASRQIVVVRPDGSRVANWPMPGSLTAEGPHIAALPDGGWVATLPTNRGQGGNPTAVGERSNVGALRGQRAWHRPIRNPASIRPDHHNLPGRAVCDHQVAIRQQGC